MRRLKKAYVEISNICNLKCAFCPGTGRLERSMSAEEFSLIAKRLAGHTQYLYFHLMGEPLLHPELGKLLEIAGQLGFKVIISTNGTLLDREGETLLSAPALHRVNISLQSYEGNGGTAPEAYVRSCADFARRASESGRLCILRLWNRNGLEGLNGRIEDTLRGAFPGEWTADRSGYKLCQRVWLEYGDRFDWPDLSAERRGDNVFCLGLRDQIGVLCDGTVVPCCLDHEGDIPLGNLFEQSLEEILASERATAIYRGFSARQAAEELCRRCGFAERFT